jgi:hypothetical protein
MSGSKKGLETSLTWLEINLSAETGEEIPLLTKTLAMDGRTPRLL